MTPEASTLAVPFLCNKNGHDRSYVDHEVDTTICLNYLQSMLAVRNAYY